MHHPTVIVRVNQVDILYCCCNRQLRLLYVPQTTMDKGDKQCCCFTNGYFYITFLIQFFNVFITTLTLLQLQMHSMAVIFLFF